jgi:hypothetical protein
MGEKLSSWRENRSPGSRYARDPGHCKSRLEVVDGIDTSTGSHKCENLCFSHPSSPPKDLVFLLNQGVILYTLFSVSLGSVSADLTN